MGFGLESYERRYNIMCVYTIERNIGTRTKIKRSTLHLTREFWIFLV